MTHNVYRHEYRHWISMKTRCNNVREPRYAEWGGRGIKVCPLWESDFEAFLRDVGPRPSTEHSLDRIDNSRGYEPGNVRWATRAQQQRNTRRNRLLTFRGKTQPLIAWCEEVGIAEDVLRKRVRMGWPTERALTAPVSPVYQRNKRVTHCVRGHPLTDENAPIYDGSRKCRACKKIRKQVWLEAQ